MIDTLTHGIFDPPEAAQRLTIYVGETDRWQGVPLYEAIVLKARELHLAGATVLRGPMSFGANSRIHTAKILRMSEDLPMIIEIVDVEKKIASFIPYLKAVLQGGLVTIENVGVLVYSPTNSTAAHP